MKENSKIHQFFQKNKSPISTILTFSLFIITISGLANPKIDDQGIWYASLIGEGTYLWWSMLFLVPLVIMFIVGLKTKRTKKIFESKLSFVYRIMGIIICISLIILLPASYDVVYMDDDAPMFESHRVFENTKTYTLDDVAYGYMENTSDMWLEMKDGEKVYFMYGISINPQEAEDPSKYGELQSDLVDILSKNNITLTIKNRSSVDNTIKKYQGRSDLEFWQTYMPNIVSKFSQS